MSEFDHLIPVMQSILESEVILGPALASAGVGGLDKSTYDVVYQHSVDLAAEISGKQPITISLHPAFEVAPSVIRSAMVEAISSTAAYLSHIRLGYLDIDESMVLVAHRLVRKAVQDFGPNDVLTLSLIVNAYDNCKVIHHYGRVLVSQFVSGELHRPWIQYTLDLELAAHFLAETMKLVIHGGQQYVALTEVGQRRFKQYGEFLSNSGFLRRRADLARRSQFSQLEEYDEMMRTISSIDKVREDVLQASGIRPGMRVLELGCGTGEMTLAAGLYKLVGAEGNVVATDPSVGMLVRARSKLHAFPDANVQFVEAAAEDLPFEDNSFDAVVGCEFMHFTDIPAVLREVHRVSKPGAYFTTIYALQIPQTNDFFLEWFAPVLWTDGKSNRATLLPDETLVRNTIESLPYASVRINPYDGITYYQHPEMVVKFMVQVANVFDSAMEELPWKAQQDMIQLLIQRGHDVVKKYGSAQLVQIQPNQLLQARVVK